MRRGAAPSNRKKRSAGGVNKRQHYFVLNDNASLELRPTTDCSKQNPSGSRRDP